VSDDGVKPLDDTIDVFSQDKKNLRVSEGVLGKYTRELDRFRAYKYASWLVARGPRLEANGQKRNRRALGRFSENAGGEG